MIVFALRIPGENRGGRHQVRSVCKRKFRSLGGGVVIHPNDNDGAGVREKLAGVFGICVNLREPLELN